MQTTSTSTSPASDAPANEPSCPSSHSTSSHPSEIHEYLYIREQRRRILPRAVLVGLCAGGTAIGFRAALALMDAFRFSLITWSYQFRYGWLFPVGFGVAGTVVAVSLVRQFAPETSGSGIPHLEAVLRRYRPMRWRNVLPVKFLGGALAIGSGLALGREGPTVQMGGAIGAVIGDWLKVSTRERLTLIVVGAGAGLSAAFNAPLSGLVFVLEELQRDFRRGVFGAALVAAAVADILARFVSGQLPMFAVPSYPVPPLITLPVFVLLGLLTGALGVFFNRTLIATLGRFAGLPFARLIWLAAFVGGFIGLVGWFIPEAGGGGHELTEAVLVGHVALAAIPLWFLLRFVMTIASYSTGAPGGIFAPLLVLGALIGLGVGQVTHLLLPNVVAQPEIFAVVGMAAFFAAIVRAPLTGVVLILEMTGNYWQLLPLMTACFSAYLVAEYLRDLPIYERLLQRDLARSGISAQVEEPMVVEMEVQPGAPFVGKRVHELGLPAGCILVECRTDHDTIFPTATTRLAPHMRIIAMIAPDAASCLALLREGCEAND